MAQNGNANLYVSKSTKADEFYTQLSTIEDELKHYRHFFKGKIIFCNCDDPYESNFFKYFALNFNSLGLKKLISTCYSGSSIAYTQLSLFDDIDETRQKEDNRKPYKIEITEVIDTDNSGNIDLTDVQYLLKNKKNAMTLLDGDGDFRSPECLALLKECDVVVTNPPFSLMKEYLPLMISSGKHFLVLGNINHAMYKENFPFIIEKKMWLGYNSGHFWFTVPDTYEEKGTDFKIDENGQKWRRMGNICWFTNFDVDCRHQPLDLYKKYTPEEFPSFDNYDAIKVKNVADIPCDTDKVMGVPITYLAKHCEEQFEIIGELRNGGDNKYDFAKPVLEGNKKFQCVLIKNRKPEIE